MPKTSDFDYSFPKSIIANEPAAKRDHSRLMVLDRSRGTIDHKIFFDIVDCFSPGDLLVLNDTKVLPANIVGKKEGGSANIEVLLAKRIEGNTWECLVRPGKRLSVGSRIVFGDNEVLGKVREKLETGEQLIEFEGDLHGFMMKNGEIPLPPYIEN
ncbi:MAG TPA: S-adenosylmethionine:tRNA ribosyltransferase-isomerase, partial [Candidatus Omnitrophota bacterium]|nr:S-adenosylmethionine:tRNA ribosyltransferase-isomerase [Candidatus Omnitrophota bacterium]